MPAAKRAAKPAPPAKPAPAPAPAPRRATAAPAKPAAPPATAQAGAPTAAQAPAATAPALRVRTGVYLDAARQSAIVVRVKDELVWYLNIMTGQVRVDCCGAERFCRMFPIHLPAYPILRAIRVYKDSFFKREEHVDKIMHRVLTRM